MNNTHEADMNSTRPVKINKALARKLRPYERHGHTPKNHRTSTYLVWQNMIQRCTNPKRPDFSYYGGRGITVCDSWKNSFAAFLADMGNRPAGKTLDRINNSLGYGPDNCRWATKHEQMQNTRGTHLISFGGEAMGIAAWARKLGINKESMRTRLLRWPLEKALTLSKTR